MAEARVERRLAAILAADIAGYSRLMGNDEEGTLAALKACRRELIEPKIAEYRGRIVKTTGDGALVEFASAVDATRCAVEIQHAMTERNAAIPEDRRVEFRIGINVGDIIIDGGDIFGDGVNVAARLEAFAEPGGICVSGRAHEDVRGKVDATFEDVGQQRLKNLPRAVQVYRVRIGAAARKSGMPTLPDKPSIAVLPFQNMSGDPEQEYFADGMVEEIITALSRMRWLFVIARNSSFTYKGRPVDIKQVGRELGVRYVLEGSVRKSANRVRITGQLIDAGTGVHLWADRFEGALEDVFDLQDRITSSVVGAITPKLEQAEIERARHKPTENLDAYDYFLRGLASFYLVTNETQSEALRCFHKALEIDPAFASASGMAAWCYANRKSNGWMVDVPEEIAEATRLARRAVEMGRDDAVALSSGGFALAYVAGDHNGIAFVERALTLNPNLASAWYLSGRLNAWLGEPDAAIEHLANAMRLSPLDPLMFGLLHTTGLAHFLAARYEEALLWESKALREKPNFVPALRVIAASNALIGRPEEARKAVAQLLKLDPTMRVAHLQNYAPGSRPEDLSRYMEGLRKAGLPE